jgi:hypothetical protein
MHNGALLRPSIILVAVVNAILGFALAEAVIFRRWNRNQALEGGERLRMYGTSFKSVSLAGNQTSLIAVASVVVTILAINGLPLQRAISTNVCDVHDAKLGLGNDI